MSKRNQPEAVYVPEKLPLIEKVPARLIIHDTDNAKRRSYGYTSITVDYRQARQIMDALAEALREDCH